MLIKVTGLLCLQHHFVGAVDAVYPPDSDENAIKNFDKLLSDVYKLLKEGGSYLLISLLQEHILKKILDFYLPLSCDINIYEIILKKSKYMPFLVHISKKASNSSKDTINLVSADAKTFQILHPSKLLDKIRLSQINNSVNQDIKKLVSGKENS